MGITCETPVENGYCNGGQFRNHLKLISLQLIRTLFIYTTIKYFWDTLRVNLKIKRKQKMLSLKMKKMQVSSVYEQLQG